MERIEQKKMFKEIMAKDFPNLIKDRNFQTQNDKQTSSRIKSSNLC